MVKAKSKLKSKLSRVQKTGKTLKIPTKIQPKISFGKPTKKQEIKVNKAEQKKLRAALRKAKAAEPKVKKPSVPKAAKKEQIPRKEMDILPPPPPDFYKTKSGDEFKPSGHELSKIVLTLRKDIDYIVTNRKFLSMDIVKLMIHPMGEILKVLDNLKDDKKYVDDIKEIEKKVLSYESLPSKGWLSEKRIKEARNYLEAYKLVAEDTRKEIIERLEDARKQREIEEKKLKAEEEKAKKKETIKPAKEPKSKPKKTELIEEEPSEKKSFFGRFAAKQKEKEPEMPKFGPAEEEAPELGEEQPKPSHKEVKKHISKLAKSISHFKKHKPMIEKVEGKIDSLSHKELKSSLEKLESTKEHLDNIENIEEQVAAHASVEQEEAVKSKLDAAQKLLDKHKVDTAEHKARVSGLISSVKAKIKNLEKAHNESKEKEEKLKQEKASHDAKLAELKKHIKFVVSNKSLMELPEEKLAKKSSKDLYKISNRLNILKQYLGEIDDVEEHFVAESSKPDTLTAGHYLEDARKLIKSYKIDTERDKELIDKKISLIKSYTKQAEEGLKAPEAMPEFNPAVEPEQEIEEKEEARETAAKKKKSKKTAAVEPKEISMPEPGEIEVPVPDFGKPSSDILDLSSRLKKTLAYISKNSKLLLIPDNTIQGMIAWKKKKTIGKLNELKQKLADLEDIEEHIAAQISTSQEIASEKLLDDMKIMINRSGIEADKCIENIDTKLDAAQALKPEEKKEPQPEEMPMPEFSLDKKLPNLKIKAKAKEEEAPAEEKVPELKEMPKPSGVPSKKLALSIYRLKRDLKYISKLSNVLEMSDDVLRSLSSWRLKGIAKNVGELKERLTEAEDIEESVIAQSSVAQSPAVEAQLQEARELLSSSNINLSEKLKDVYSKIEFINSLKPGAVKYKAPESEMPKLEEKPAAEFKALDVGKPKPELDRIISSLKATLSYIAKNQKILDISDDALTSLSPRKKNKIVSDLTVLKQKLAELSDIEEELVAEKSLSQPLAVESQIQKIDKIIGSYNIDSESRIKDVESKLDALQAAPELPKFAPAKELEMPKLEEEIPETTEIPELPEIEEVPEGMPVPDFGKPKEKMPKFKPGVPVFKPSAFELQALIARLKRDLNYISKHEKYIHLPEEKILSLSHKEFDRIFSELKDEEKYLDDLEKAESVLENYEAIPDKGWLSEKKINDARSLLEAYKSTNVSVIRKMLLNRLSMMQGRKIKSENVIKKAELARLEEKGTKELEEADVLKELEAKMAEEERAASQEIEGDLKSMRLLKAAEKEKAKRLTGKQPEIIRAEPPKAVKPILEKDKFEAYKEITEAIGAVKAQKAPVRNRVEYIMSRIDDARNALQDLDIQTAKEIYVDIHGAYTQLKPLEQFRVYEAIKSLYEERKAAEKLVS